MTLLLVTLAMLCGLFVGAAAEKLWYGGHRELSIIVAALPGFALTAGYWAGYVT